MLRNETATLGDARHTTLCLTILDTDFLCARYHHHLHHLCHHHQQQQQQNDFIPHSRSHQPFQHKLEDVARKYHVMAALPIIGVEKSGAPFVSYYKADVYEAWQLWLERGVVKRICFKPRLHDTTC